MSFCKLTYHIVFATKRRERTISIEKEKLIYQILYSICKDKKVFVHRIGGMPDHIHLLVEIPPTLAVSELVSVLKSESSKRIRQYSYLINWDGWSEGYGAFSVSPEAIPSVKNYIINQKSHHSVTDFHAEFCNWLIENGIDPNTPFFPK